MKVSAFPPAAVTVMNHLHDVLQLRVRYSETDQMGTFYNSRALDWFECGRTELLRRKLGMSYAALEGLFLGAISFVLANFRVSGTSAGALIGQAILGTVGVFFGMLVVYKTGAIRVTPKFTRMLVAAMIGALVLMLGNFLISMFSTHDGGPLRNGGTMAIIFSLVMIVIAAFSFLVDFDSADQMIRAGAPEKAAWGIALGLTVTLVWLYLEILRLLSYFQND